MRAAVLLALLAVAACGDNHAAPPGDDAAAPAIDAAITIDAGIDAPPGALAPCLDRPTDLPRPPSGQLPCELIPPGFGS